MTSSGDNAVPPAAPAPAPEALAPHEEPKGWGIAGVTAVIKDLLKTIYGDDKAVAALRQQFGGHAVQAVRAQEVERPA